LSTKYPARKSHETKEAAVVIPFNAIDFVPSLFFPFLQCAKKYSHASMVDVFFSWCTVKPVNNDRPWDKKICGRC
jgi:hypothetical protein